MTAPICTALDLERDLDSETDSVMDAVRAGGSFSVAELQRMLRGARRPGEPRPLTGHRLRLLSDRSATGGLPALGEDCVAVLAAHPGAGASTVALAIADAADASSRAVHLVECCLAGRSGLLAATSTELGAVHEGQWLRGGRGTSIIIDRQAAAAVGESWPALPVPECLEIADLALDRTDGVGGRRAVVVCRATVPGIRQAERLLSYVARATALAVLGPARWPGAVTVTAGPHIRRLCDEKRVVAVPVDRRLEVCGPTAAPLPKKVRAAGRTVLTLIDAADPIDDGPPPTSGRTQVTR